MRPGKIFPELDPGLCELPDKKCQPLPENPGISTHAMALQPLVCRSLCMLPATSAIYRRACNKFNTGMKSIRYRIAALLVSLLAGFSPSGICRAEDARPDVDEPLEDVVRSRLQLGATLSGRSRGQLFDVVAGTLARLVRAPPESSASRSPWPFRVAARDGAIVEEYTSNVVSHLRLLDMLVGGPLVVEN